MSEMTHTPLPWTVKRWSWPMTITGNVHQVTDEYGYPSAFVPAWDNAGEGEHDGTEEARANAAFIVTACNSHYDNLATIAALKAENERLREALEPFSRMAGVLFSANKNANEPLYGFGKRDKISVIYVGDFFKARAALTKQEG